MKYDEKYIKEFIDCLYMGIMFKLDGVILNGSEEYRYVGNLNLFFVYVEGESFFMGLKEVVVFSGSVCISVSFELLYVLWVLGVEEDMVYIFIRFGIGRFIIKEEIDRVVVLIVD